MTSINIHVIAGVIRSFLSSLKEPLLTYTARESFIKVAYMHEETDAQVLIFFNTLESGYSRSTFVMIYLDSCHCQTLICSLVPELPRPNRDTLAYLILHFQRFFKIITFICDAFSYDFLPLQNRRDSSFSFICIEYRKMFRSFNYWILSLIRG